VSKIIIVYASKCGGTTQIVERLATLLRAGGLNDTVDVVALKAGVELELANYDTIIIGSPLYAGKILKEVHDLVSYYRIPLAQKKVGLFLTGMDQGDERIHNHFVANYPKSLLEASWTTAFLGGIYDPKKVSFIERFIMKKVAKQTTYIERIDQQVMVDFAKYMLYDPEKDGVNL